MTPREQSIEPAPQTRPVPDADAPLVILPLGDSNTWGTGNPDATGDPATTVGYRLALKRSLAAAGVACRFVGSFRVGHAVFDDCATEGWPGKGINTLIWRVHEGLLERLEPDVCLLLIGSNNLWRSLEDRRPISPFRTLYWLARLLRLLYLMHRHRPDMRILIGKPATPTSAAVPLTIYRAGIGVLDFAARAVRVNWRAVDLRAPNDGVHYTPAGHSQVADAWCRSILTTSR